LVNRMLSARKGESREKRASGKRGVDVAKRNRNDGRIGRGRNSSIMWKDKGE